MEVTKTLSDLRYGAAAIFCIWFGLSGLGLVSSWCLMPIAIAPSTEWNLFARILGEQVLRQQQCSKETIIVGLHIFCAVLACGFCVFVFSTLNVIMSTISSFLNTALRLYKTLVS